MIHYKQFFKEIRPILVVAFLYATPILLLNNMYYDDIGRSIYGYFSWGIDGRPLSDVIMKMLILGSPATDISPYPQIMCLIIMSLLCYMMHKQFNPSQKFGWICFTPVFLSPFFIQNIAFKFDSLVMSLSVILAFLPIAFLKKSKINILFSTCIFSLLTFSLYQASISALTSSCAIYTLVSIHNKEKLKIIIENLLCIFFGMILGYLIYSLTIIPMFVTSDYANSYNKPVSIYEIHKVYDNLKISIGVLRTYFTGIMAIVISPYILLSAIGFIRLIIGCIHSYNTITNKFLSSSLCMLSLIVIIISIPGIGIALENMPIGPRVFIGFGFFISSLLLMSSWAFSSLSKALHIIYSILIISMFSYMATFVSAMKSQDRMTDYIIYNLSRDIQDIGYYKVKSITIDGKAMYTPIADKSIQKFPLMKQLIPSYFDGELAWGVVRMNEFYSGPASPSPAVQGNLISNLCSFELIKDAGLYRIYMQDGNMIASFNFKKC